MKANELIITSENLLAVINCTQEFVKESIISGAFEVIGYFGQEVQINVSGVYVMAQMDNYSKTARTSDRYNPMWLTSEQEKEFYKRLISGGLSQAIKLKENEILRIKNEITLMQENHKKLSITL